MKKDQPQEGNIENGQLNVFLKTKEKTLYKGPAQSISSVNSRGKFDILPYHANFITLIKDMVVLDGGTETEQKFELERGIMYVMKNSVEVYFGI